MHNRNLRRTKKNERSVSKKRNGKHIFWKNFCLVIYSVNEYSGNHIMKEKSKFKVTIKQKFDQNLWKIFRVNKIWNKNCDFLTHQLMASLHDQRSEPRRCQWAARKSQKFQPSWFHVYRRSELRLGWAAGFLIVFRGDITHTCTSAYYRKNKQRQLSYYHLYIIGIKRRIRALLFGRHTQLSILSQSQTITLELNNWQKFIKEILVLIQSPV